MFAGNRFHIRTKRHPQTTTCLLPPQTDLFGHTSHTLGKCYMSHQKPFSLTGGVRECIISYFHQQLNICHVVCHFIFRKLQFQRLSADLVGEIRPKRRSAAAVRD